MKEHLAGEGVISRVPGRKLAHQLEDVSVAGGPAGQDTAGGHGVLGGGPVPGRHTPAVGQNRRSPAAYIGCPAPELRRALLIRATGEHAGVSEMIRRAIGEYLRAR